MGWPGRVHDARVFANSSLFKRGQSGTLLPNTTQLILGKAIPLVLLGDPAYPLLKWLMKAFPDTGSLSQQQKTFNYRLSRARVVVEHTYGRLKGRWRSLLKRNDLYVGSVPELVAACCTLHNICESSGDCFRKEWMEDLSDQPSCSSNTGVSLDSSNGKVIRDTLMSYFSE